MNDDEYDENFRKEAENNRILHWNYRNLKFFPELLKSSGKHIIDLYLKGNCISIVPKWISEMDYLSEIYLTSNQLIELPEEISKLKLLRFLDVSDNQIAELPKSLTSLIELNYLIISKNLLTKLPEDIGRMKALLYLDGSENHISTIPYSITGCISLREINLGQNNLTSIPKSLVYMPNLQILFVFRNQLFYLPAIPFPNNCKMILALANEHLNHISHQVEIFNRHIRLDESENEYEKKNSNVLRNEFPSDYSVISTEKNSHLVIPMHVCHETETTVPTLEELCLRATDKLIFTNSTNTRRTEIQKFRSQLPHRICSELEKGPTAQCQNCYLRLFEFAFIRILWDEQRPKLNIIEYFCSTRCLKSFKMEQTTIFWPEIKWKRHEIGCL